MFSIPVVPKSHVFPSEIVAALSLLKLFLRLDFIKEKQEMKKKENTLSTKKATKKKRERKKTRS